MMSCCAVLPPSAAQDGGALIPLRATQRDVDRLAPGVLAETAEFFVDEAGLVMVGIRSTADGLTTSIEGPGGEILNEETIESYGGKYGTFEGADEPDSFLIMPASQPGFHYFYVFPSLGVGQYTVHFEATGLTEDEAVITEVITDSQVAANLVATESILTQGSAAVLVAFLFEGATPLTNATVSVAVKPPNSDEFQLALLDDGVGADDAIGDGLYSGMFTVTELGTYVALAEITGVNGSGTPFTRTAAAEVLVVEQGATFTTTPPSFTDTPEDDNDNGLYERVVITSEVEVVTAGTYGLTIVLKTTSGERILGHGTADLAVGTQSIDAAVEADVFRAIGEDGPYTITMAELVFVSAEGAVPSDLFEESMQGMQPMPQTLSYLISQFERPPILLTGNTSDIAVDTDQDGDFDVLSIAIEMDVLNAGDYEYTALLVDSCAGEIEFVVGQQFFTGGPEDLVFDFDGSLIGPRGIDGPYAVQDLLIFGTGGSLVESYVAVTQAYTADEFDSFLPPADCNENGVPDLCDIFDYTSLDCNLDGIPDECQLEDNDCNTNGIPDDCDIADGTSQDVNGNGIPDECELPAVCLGDSNCDETISWGDIDYLAASMNDNVIGWYTMFLPGAPACPFENNDVNEDGTVDWRDIDPLVTLMNTTCP
ncbi:MAG: hypothetical protein KAY37_10295 [Phycisphaerae bacterium]|nr:hypothetical protein [Phycisphaerae bacterium]